MFIKWFLWTQYGHKNVLLIFICSRRNSLCIFQVDFHARCLGVPNDINFCPPRKVYSTGGAALFMKSLVFEVRSSQNVQKCSKKQTWFSNGNEKCVIWVFAAKRHNESFQIAKNGKIWAEWTQKKDLHALPTSDSFRVLFDSKCNKKVFSKPKTILAKKF